jgi:hypothetical protein
MTNEERIALLRAYPASGIEIMAAASIEELVATNDELGAKLAKAVELLKEARQDLEEYVTHEWPKDEHPVYERKWERDMARRRRRIDALLAEIEGEKP